MTNSARYRINDIATLCDVSPSTIRLWEQHGLLLPHRTGSGHRLYGDADLERARRIQHLRKISGLNINAIRNVLNQAAEVRSTDAQRASSPPLSEVVQPSTGAVTGLGARFRMARLKAGLSIREASESTGLALSFISTFERTSTGATIASLQAMATCYGTTVSDLSAQDRSAADPADAVTRAGSERELPSLGSGIRILQLSDTLKLLDCQKWVLQPGSGSDGSYSHEGEELIHVIAGQFWICLDDEVEQILSPGDSVSFNSQRRHAWRAVGDEATILFWVNTPKSF